MWKELTSAISHLYIPADWIGIRAVKTTSKHHYVRDGLPQNNGKSLNMGAMIEVIVDGCLGYAATNSLDIYSLQKAAEIAYKQALSASKWWIYPVSENTRPKVVGEYNSPFLEPFNAITPGEINDLQFGFVNNCKLTIKSSKPQPALVHIKKKLGLSAVTVQKCIKKFSPSEIILGRSPKIEISYNNAPITVKKLIIIRAVGNFSQKIIYGIKSRKLVNRH